MNHMQRGPQPHIVPILEALETGEGVASVAKRYGVGEDSVRHARDRWQYWRPPAPIRSRVCLCCRRAFDSDGMRICQSCKDREEFGGLGAVQI